jgi:hypothetical protein
MAMKGQSTFSEHNQPAGMLGLCAVSRWKKRPRVRLGRPEDRNLLAKTLLPNATTSYFLNADHSLPQTAADNFLISRADQTLKFTLPILGE